MNVFELKCKVQNYAWGELGEKSKVAQLIKSNDPEYAIDSTKPYAELWMGTHPNGESIIKGNNEHLSNWIRNINGTNGQLSFLFKVLSINKALSIQSHPNKEEAQRLHSLRPDVYKDPNHKPELAIALTEFKAMCGFRVYSEIQMFIQTLPELQKLIGDSKAELFLKSPSEETLKPCFEALMKADDVAVVQCLKDIEARLKNNSIKLDVHKDLFHKLKEQFPNDVGILCIYFLNVLHLQPGQAIYLGPNIPHAYIHGDCIECMACSDNVIRAGLTPKYKDVDTLIKTLDYKGYNVDKLIFKSIKVNHYTEIFKPPVPDFAVAKVVVPPGTQEKIKCAYDSDSIIIVVEGEAESNAVKLSKGMILFIAKNEDFYINNNSKEKSFILYQAMSNSSLL
ncbi:mannose-6-phosphate isomerase [Ctenocephalides felis]|uniref:mannose-6-phosphate isomerase n=1 Tax=Ctenocephalides felis TaxID=7515 RepID=UPI000E6E4772|nr:mannose-6-phosphate isomerase [Ctenocephalides felis]